MARNASTFHLRTSLLWSRRVALISFRGVRKAFGPKVVYESLDLDIERGESITIIGGSGQGKSVMLKLLIRLLVADAGSIVFDEQEVTRLKDRELGALRRRIGMLFQGAALFDSISVGENVAYGLREHYPKMPTAERRGRVAEALTMVGLPGIEGMRPSDLSGGMKKRVGLARTIALRPEVLLYDEPTTGLDPINTTRINRLILHLKEQLQVTSIVVTHDMTSAFFVSDRIAMIHHGYVVFTGTPDEVRRARDARVRDFIEGNAPKGEDALALLREGG